MFRNNLLILLIFPFMMGCYLHGEKSVIANTDSPLNADDYTKQAWVLNGRYMDCGHPDDMDCGCWGRVHEGEEVEVRAG